MFCKKCGKKVPFWSKSCPGCGAEAVKKRWTAINIVAFLAMIAMFILIGIAVAVGSSDLPDKEILLNWLGVSWLFCFGVIVLALLAKFFVRLVVNIKSIGRRPVAGAFSIIVVIGTMALAGGIIWSVFDNLAWKEAGSQTGNIAIRAKAETISPFSILSIRARNVQTADAATSVIFEMENGNMMTIPAVEVSADKIKVPVPPYFDKDGNLASGGVSIKVIQAKRSNGQISAETSNYFSSRIAPVPELDSRIPAGKMSAVFIAAVLDSIDERLAKVSAADAELRQALAASRKAFEDLFQKINEVVKNPNEKITLKTNKGDPVTIGANDLKTLDRILWGSLQEFNKKSGFISKGPFSKIIPVAYAGTICRASLDIPEMTILRQPCEHQESWVTGWATVGKRLPEAAQLAWSPPLIMVGGAVGELGVAANLSVINQIGLSVAFSTAIDVLIQGGTTVEGAGVTILTTIGDKVLNGDFLGIMVPTATFCLHVYEALPERKALAKEAKQPTPIIISSKTDPQKVNFIESGSSGTKISNIPVPASQATALTDAEKLARKSPTAPAAPVSPPTPTPAKPPAPSPAAPTPPQPTAPAPTAPKPAAPKPPTPAPAPAQEPLGDLGQPVGTTAPKIEFTLSQSNFNATVGEAFSHSFCEPALTRASDLCTAAATNPKFGLPPYSFTLESGVGFLPYGLTLNLNGLLAGTPTAAGSRTVGICAKDTGGFSVCRRITINVESKKTVYPYDGNYTLNCVGYCTSNDPMPDCYDTGPTKSGTDYFVRENVVSDWDGHKGNVSDSGAARLEYDAVGVHWIKTINFFSSDGKMQVDSTITYTDYSKSIYGGTCTTVCEDKCSGYKR